MNSPSALVGQPLGLADVYQVAHRKRAAELCPSSRDSLQTARQRLEASLAEGRVIYGVNTGFGALSETVVSDAELEALQVNLLRSHAVGVGTPLSPPIVRALLLLRAHTLALGASGVSPELAETLLTFLDKDLLPVVPSQGSVGASGDLAPLAHLALPFIGEGQIWQNGQAVPAETALKNSRLSPYRLRPKEGLSLINGTQVTTAIAAIAIHEARELVIAADILGALTLDILLGSIKICDPRIHAGKAHPGQKSCAKRIAKLLDGSPLNRSHANCGRVQDAYSLRCMPQVHGAAATAIEYVAQTLTIELNSVSDNPLVLEDEQGGFDVISGGNFHAGSVALPIDHASAALTTLSTISERRLDRALNPDSSNGLPAFLADNPGVESGFMMAQVTASALASENKTLSFPASVDTIPTSAGKEDHVSMGPIAARKLASVVENFAHILAIEASIAARALDLREHDSSEAMMNVYEGIREFVPPHTGDRSMSGEFTELAKAIRGGHLRRCAGLDSPTV